MKRSTPPSPAGDLSGLGESPSQKEKGAKLESLKELSYDDAELDKSIFSSYKRSNVTQLPKEGIHQAMLVAKIVRQSSGLDQRYGDDDEAEILLQMYGDQLVPLMEDCWAKKSFTAIRKLVILQSSPMVENKEPRKKKGAFLPSLTQKVVTNAWGKTYAGQSHVLLHESINAMERTKAYSTTVAIVQSSGTGKSRMVDEQANLVFTIPFCLRDPYEENVVLSYPPADTAVYDHLRKPSFSSLEDADNYFLRFFTSLFCHVRMELENHDLSSIGNFPGSWRSYLREGDNRQRLYTSVVAAAKAEPIVDGSAEKAAAEEALRLLLKKIDELTIVPRNERDVKLMIYFDEAHTLTNYPTDPKDLNGKDLYDCLLSCLVHFIDQPLFTIFLSTNSSLSNLAPPSRDAKSARARDASKNLQAPITETPFDCYPGFLVQPDTLSWQDVSTIQFMAKFGRPLFWSMLEGYKEGDSLTNEMLEFARSKLVCSTQIEERLEFYKDTATAALLDCRIMLDYAPSREEAFRQEVALVASHMRIAYSVPTSREALHSGYSSEPLLAEAAAQQLAHFRRTQSSDPELNILEINSKGKIVDLGLRGELVARHLLMLAYDRAVEADYRKEFPNDPNCSKVLYSRGCSVITFIRELYSEKLAEVVLNSVPDNLKSGRTFRDAFKTARLRFTHFAKLADESGATTEAMFAAFVRGMAFVGHDTQQLLDFILPVLLWDELLSEAVMTCIFISVKRRSRAGSLAAYAIAAETLKFFPDYVPITPESERDPARRPYITIIMELGVQNLPSFKSRIPRKVAVKRQPPSAPANNRNSRPRTPPNNSVKIPERTPSKLIVPEQGSPRRAKSTHPRYSVFAYGCSNTVYKVIEISQRGKYANLLKMKGLLEEHPRGGLALLAVRKLKPFWSQGEASFHWIKDNFLQGPLYKEDIKEIEVVVAGKYEENGNEDE